MAGVISCVAVVLVMIQVWPGVADGRGSMRSSGFLCSCGVVMKLDNCGDSHGAGDGASMWDNTKRCTTSFEAASAMHTRT